MAAVFQTTFSNAFSWMKMYEFRLRFHWSLFLRFQLINIPALVLIMAWRPLGDKPLSEPMMVSLPTHICVTRPRWVKQLGRWPFFNVIFFFLMMFPTTLIYLPKSGPIQYSGHWWLGALAPVYLWPQNWVRTHVFPVVYRLTDAKKDMTGLSIIPKYVWKYITTA